MYFCHNFSAYFLLLRSDFASPRASLHFPCPYFLFTTFYVHLCTRTIGRFAFPTHKWHHKWQRAYLPDKWTSLPSVVLTPPFFFCSTVLPPSVPFFHVNRRNPVGKRPRPSRGTGLGHLAECRLNRQTCCTATEPVSRPTARINRVHALRHAAGGQHTS